MSGLDWLGRRTILLGVSGSHAYGTSAPESDVDLRGIAVAPLSFYLGVGDSFEQADALPPTFWPDVERDARTGDRLALARTSTDAQVMDLRKFVALAADCNPNILEILFLPDEAIALARPAWEPLREAREACLSRRARFTFAGYAHSQLKRIHTHRKWLLNPPERKPERKDFGLPDRLPIPKDQYDAAKSLVERRLQSWSQHRDVEIPATMAARLRDAMTDLTLALRPGEDPQTSQVLAAGAQLGFDANFLEHLDRERRYRQALAWFHQYEQWKENRNPARSRMEAQVGYDVKHASHLIRLLRMACEVLSGEGVIVRRPDAGELLAIRRGEWTFERLLAEAEGLDAEAERRLAATALPATSDRARLDAACRAAIAAVEAVDPT